MTRTAREGGVIMATGNENAGASVFIKDDRLVFDYNIFGEHHVVTSSDKVPEGESTVGPAFSTREERR